VAASTVDVEPTADRTDPLAHAGVPETRAAVAVDRIEAGRKAWGTPPQTRLPGTQTQHAPTTSARAHPRAPTRQPSAALVASLDPGSVRAIGAPRGNTMSPTVIRGVPIPASAHPCVTLTCSPRLEFVSRAPYTPFSSRPFYLICP
jgi:hypothetical protein